MTLPVIILIVVIVVIALFLVSLYNGLVTKRNRIDEAFAQIEVQLKRRHDLIPNLINAVKGYMGFEQKVLTEVTEARANAVSAGAQGPAQQAAAENALTGTLRSLFAVVENYPELKANENVLKLQEELTTTENQISFSRQHYNATRPRLQQRDPDVPGRPDRRSVRLPQARVLRRGARGGDGPDGRPQPQLSPAATPDLSRHPHDRRRASERLTWPRSTTRSAPTGATRCCSRSRSPRSWASSACSSAGPLTGDPRAAIPSHADRDRPRARGLAGLVLHGRLDRARRRRARRRSTSARSPQLLNVVREMALAANVPMPKVYLIDDTAPNAFATGRDPQHASVAITIGLLQKLDREEVQGVMAHELSHVRNYDIRFSLMVGVLVGLDRAAGGLLPAVHVLGRGPPLAQRLGQRGRGAADRRVRDRHRARDPRADRRPPRPAGRSAASASTWRTPRASS